MVVVVIMFVRNLEHILTIFRTLIVGDNVEVYNKLLVNH